MADRLIFNSDVILRTTDQKVRGSNPFGRTISSVVFLSFFYKS